MIKLTVDRNDIEGMIERGVKLHGHAGPYLNLGIKMGLLALNMLDVSGYFDLSAEVKLEYRTPVCCLVDGLQISTGCTMGKGNIKVKNNPGIISAFFEAGNKALLVTLKPEITKLINFKKENCEDLGQKVLNMSHAELFNYEYEEKNESSQNYRDE